MVRRDDRDIFLSCAFARTDRTDDDGMTGSNGAKGARQPVFRRIRRGAPLAGLLVALALAACSSPEEREAEHLARGIELLDAGDHARALVELRNVLQINPKNAEAMYYAGQAHEQAGRLPQAYAAYQQAVGEAPGLVPAQARLGALALLDKDLERASEAAEAIHAAEPDHPAALAIEGALALRQDDTQGALALARQALETVPQHEEAVAVLVGAYHRLGENARAIERLDQAIAAHPDTIPLRLLKLVILEDDANRGEGDLQQISATYEELFELDQESAFYRIALAEFQRRQGNLSEAETVLRDAALDDRIDTSHAARGLVRLILQEQGQEAAVSEVETLIERRPEDLALRFLLAELLAGEKRFDAAEEVLDAVITREAEAADTDEPTPTINDARASIAQIRVRAGDVTGAAALAREVLDADRDHRLANLVLGIVAFDDGAFDEAIRSARSALREDPGWLPALRLIAQTHVAAGETELARTALDQVIALAPNDLASIETLARLLTEQGDFNAALKLWDTAVRISDDPGPAIRARAEVEMRRGNFNAAQADIDHLLDIPEQQFAGSLLAGDLMLIQNRFDESQSWFERASQLRPDAPQAVVGLVRTAVTAGETERAIDYLEQRLREHPDEVATYDLMGSLLIDLDRPDAAEKALREAIRLQPEWTTPYQRLGRMLRERGEHEDAAAVYLAALDQMPGNRTMLGDLAFTHYLAGDYVAAADAYERLLETGPDGPDGVINNYAGIVALHLHDDPERLGRALDLASERFRTSNDPSRLDLLGWLHYRDGDYPLAATFLERAVAAAPDEPEIRYHLGMALYHSGRKERALEELDRALGDDADYPGVDEARTMHARLQAELEQASNG